MRKLLVLFSLLLVTACIPSYKLLKTGNRVMWDSYTVATAENINEMQSEKAISWTQYGPILENIQFIKPLKEGDKIPGDYKDDVASKVPAYRTGMTPEEVVELYRSSVSLNGKVVTEISELTPRDIGGLAGYSFEAFVSTPKGKDLRVKIYFVEKDSKLYLIEFGARAVHYYQARLQTAEQVVNSLTF
ncbi:hypothetical protein [Sneathiella limimaris]|uniref:hypothetical protein n=1 Tax=Sneathiella limimaris TaxID=1964213 RepID=UPI00146BB01E|nr:hypothetical protein [Sneathiella limimaris]